jgi:hypothetical protein
MKQEAPQPRRSRAEIRAIHGGEHVKRERLASLRRAGKVRDCSHSAAGELDWQEACRRPCRAVR